MRFLLGIALLGVAAGCSHAPVHLDGDPQLHLDGESHLFNIRQLTHGGTSGQASWSFDGRKIVFQHRGPFQGPKGEIPGPECDQIYSMNPDGSDLKMLSNGKGETTSSFFLPAGRDDRVLFSSTSAFDEKCPGPPEVSLGGAKPISQTYQLFTAKTDGTDPIPFEPGGPKAYTAEAKACQDGSVIFTSNRDGDLELYRGKLDRLGTLSEISRITNAPGYDGGASFSPDCHRIVWSASRPKKNDLKEYQSLLKQHLVQPTQLEIWTADADGSHAHPVTRMGAVGYAPVFAPDGKRILFAASPRDPRESKFDLYLIRVDGTHLERVTYTSSFENFPMFSPDGKQLTFTSSRNSSTLPASQVFIADWQDPPHPAPLSLDDSNAANRLMAEIEALNSPAMEGRRAGTAGLSKAEEHVALQFAALGLKPFFEKYPTSNSKGYKQKIEMTLSHEHTVVAANNIAGTWGKGCGVNPPVIIGAQLGHQPGADDHASGIAALMEVARSITNQSKPDPRACFVFTVFAGEKAGTEGSSGFFSLLGDFKLRPKAILNLGEVVSMKNNHVIIYGSGSSSEWNEILQSKCEESRLGCEVSGEGYGPTDPMASHAAGAPFLDFYTGTLLDDHTTPEMAEQLNATGGVQVAELVAAVALQAASPRQRFHYQKKTSSPAQVGSTAYLGTVPDYSALPSPHEGGLRLAGVKSGSPAQKAGVKEGDVLTGIDDKRVRALEDFMNILVHLKPGNDVALHIRRKETEMTLPATVGRRE